VNPTIPSDIPRAAPPLETARLLLSAHRAADYADCLSLWTNPDVTRQIGGTPSTPQEVWSRILRYAGHWALLGYGYWVAREKESGRFVGEVGFADWKRDVLPTLDGLPELGYALVPWSHGQGYATEAVLAVQRWLDQRGISNRTWCLIHPEAAASKRVAEKAGFHFMQEALYRENPVSLYVRDRP
jgi:RimJ/RimL family protein N-acetyltransferase